MVVGHGTRSWPTFPYKGSDHAAVRGPLYLGIALQAISVALILAYVGIGAWDDGAITLAFSKTFSQTGRMALTPLSEQVEGFSSISWFLLNAAAAKLKPDFAAAIAYSQLMTAAFVAVSLCYLSAMSRSLGLSTAATAVVMVLAAISGPSLAETANGMEMSLLAASALAVTYHLYFRRSATLVLVATLVFIATRFEAIFYFPFLIAPLVLLRRYKEAAAWSAAALVVFGALEIFRYDAFGALLPNTISAKMNPPYRATGMEALRSRLRSSLELLRILVPFVAVDVVLALRLWARNGRLARPQGLSPRMLQLTILALPIAAAEAFAIVAGKNTGYPGRMEFFAIPYALLLLALGYDAFSRSLAPNMRRLALFGILLTVPISGRVCTKLQMQTVRNSFAKVDPSSSAAFEVTPNSYRFTALAVDRLRLLLDMDSIVFMTPDVGGASLCCDRIRIVDVAMLANRELARRGYAALPGVLEAEKPDVIEVHKEWSAWPGIYELARFNSDYLPAVIDNTRLFLRKDHAEQLLKTGAARLCSMADPECRVKIMVNHRYRRDSSPADDEQYRKNASYVEIL